MCIVLFVLNYDTVTFTYDRSEPRLRVVALLLLQRATCHEFGVCFL